MGLNRKRVAKRVARKARGAAAEMSAGRRAGDGPARWGRSAQTKTPWGCPHGVFEKPGDTYFRECSHYHRPGVLNYCVRNGNRCFHHGMVARKSAGGGKTRPHLPVSKLTVWLFEQEWHDRCEMCDLRFTMSETRRRRQSDIFNLPSNISHLLCPYTSQSLTKMSWRAFDKCGQAFVR
jgi:hypothetical protein